MLFNKVSMEACLLKLSLTAVTTGNWHFYFNCVITTKPLNFTIFSLENVNKQISVEGNTARNLRSFTEKKSTLLRCGAVFY